MDTLNRFMVSKYAEGEVIIMSPPRGPMTGDQAMMLAAWLISMALMTSDLDIKDCVEAVENT